MMIITNQYLNWMVMEWLRRAVRIPSSEPITTIQQPIQLSILPRSVNEYSEVDLTVQTLDTH